MTRKAWLIPLLTLGLSMGLSILVFASGWSQTSSGWRYLDSNNNPVTNEWKKGADDKWRYLNSSGYMATSTWVEDEYYVDSNGIMVSDSWLKLNDDGTEYWYYFTSSGKAVTSDWKTINGNSYYFDEDGHMLTGWILDNTYFIGTDGIRVTGWQNLYPPEDEDDDDDDDLNYKSSTDGKYWYYFLSNGKKYVPDDEFGEKTIDGKRYSFYQNGRLVTGWVNLEGTSGDSASITDYKYYNEDGTVRTGWYSLEPPEDIADRYDNSVEWFYFSSKGVPYAAESEDYKTTDFVKISGKQYLFDENGVPVYGLQKVYIGSTGYYTAYYFGTSSECYIQKGKTTIKELSGDSYTYYFNSSSGRGMHGVKDNKLYYMGKPIEAASGTKYQVISLPNETSSGYVNYLVSTSGKVMKNGTYKDADKVSYTVNSSGVLTKIDGETDGIDDQFEVPEEPEWEDE